MGIAGCVLVGRGCWRVVLPSQSVGIALAMSWSCVYLGRLKVWVIGWQRPGGPAGCGPAPGGPCARGGAREGAGEHRPDDI
jgi:hypothetical protein